MLEEVKGLVIRSVNIKESDRLLTIFTEQHGVLTALARGARNYKSRKMSSTMQFCYSTFVLDGSGDKLWIKESELIDGFYGIRDSIEALALSNYVAEVLSEVTTSVADKELLRLALNSLYALSSGKYSPDKVKAAFEIRCAAILGFMPDVLSCHLCKGREGSFFFDIMGGYVECDKCRHERERLHTEDEDPHESRIITILSEGAKTALAYCIYSPLEKLFSFNLSNEDMRLFTKAAELYLVNQLERSFRSLEFYNEVKR